jgi:hypothetical protein
MAYTAAAPEMNVSTSNDCGNAYILYEQTLFKAGQQALRVPDHFVHHVSQYC